MSALLAAASAAALLPMAAVALYNVATAPRLHRAPSPRRPVRVSVLVPARDEAGNLLRTLPALLAQRHPELELLVLDDGSVDDTAGVVERLARGDGRLRLLRGLPLPEGWLGKNWACHQLARAATGEVLLFCDADVRAEPDAVERTVGLLDAWEADAATALPRQRTRCWAERAVVPLVAQLPVAAMLPLALVPRLRAPSLSMANGQWLAFRRAAYRRCGGHAAVRGEVLEDVALGRAVKAAGGRLVVAAAPRSLSVRMYRGWGEVRAGFGKNLYPLLGGRPAPFAALVLLLGVAWLYPWLGALAGRPEALPALALLVAVRAAAAGLLDHGWRSVALHPLGASLALGIALRSARAHGRGGVEWKGRTVAPLRPSAPVIGHPSSAVPGPMTDDR